MVGGWVGNEIRLNMNLIVLELVEECLGLQYVLLFTFVYGFTFLRFFFLNFILFLNFKILY